MTTGGWVEGRVLGWRHWDAGLATLRVDADVQDFEAGQFFQLGLDLDGERVRRSYSASSAPGTPLEFYLTNVAGGALTPSLFQLPEGGRLWVERTARGFFALRHVPRSTCLWLISTGTGLGPFVSMLRTPSTWQHATRFVVVLGVRTSEQLAYRRELEELSRAAPLRYVPVVSGARELPESSHLSGRITTLLERGALEQAAQEELRPEQSQVMLCGNPSMITEMLERLETRGLRRHRVRQPGHVTIEKYW